VDAFWRWMGGGRLHDFLNVLRIDKTYAFGPTKKQKGWPPERLAKMHAVGVYKLKSRLKPTPRKPVRRK
jgi:hypothetical protein